MAYEWEREAHRQAVRAMNEFDRALAHNEARRQCGITGDPEDNSYGADDGDDQ